MPEQQYSRADLISAFRAENPDATHIPDNKIFAAIAVEDPELAKGISELKGPAPLTPAGGFVSEAKKNAVKLGGILMNTAPGAVSGDAPLADAWFGAGVPSSGASMVSRANPNGLGVLAAYGESPVAQTGKAILNSETVANIAAKLKGLAAANRAAYEAAPSIIDTVKVNQPLTVLRAANTVTRPIRAAAEEVAGKALSGGMPVTRAEIAADEAARIASTAGAPREDFAPTPQGGFPRPEVPQHIQDQLQAVREAETPEQMYERLRQQRDRQASMPRQDFAPDAKGGFERPSPLPFPIPFEGGMKLTPPDVNRWLGVSSKEVLRGADPGKQLIEQGLLGATKAATKANVEAALADAGQSLDLQLKAATNKGVTIDAQTPVYDGIMGAIKKLGSPRDTAFQANLNGLLDDIETKYPDLGRLTPEQTHSLKVDLGDSAKWTGAGADDPINRVKIQIYSDLNNAIKDGVEGIGRTQDRWRNLYIANKATARAIAKDVVGTGTGDAPVVRQK